ncbi:MAG: hypothetical protein IK038_02880 [Bacteroidaceae bacterium]|nr:hypothetical protein [Bacteroidaceae bacterium]
MEKISLTCGHLRNRRHCDLPEDVFMDFLKRPASERVVLLGFPKPTDVFIPDSLEDLMQKAGVGTLDRIIEKNGESLAVMTIDPMLPCGKTLAKMLEGGVKMGFSLRGIGEAAPGDSDNIQFTEITGVTLYPEPHPLV